MNLILSNALKPPHSSSFIGFEQKPMQVQALFHPKQNLAEEISASLKFIQDRFYEWVIMPSEEISMGYNSKWSGRFAIKEVEVLKEETSLDIKPSILSIPQEDIVLEEDKMDPIQPEDETSKAVQLENCLTQLQDASKSLLSKLDRTKQGDPVLDISKLDAYLSETRKILDEAQKLDQSHQDPTKLNFEDVPSLVELTFHSVIEQTLNTLHELGCLKKLNSMTYQLCQYKIPKSLILRFISKFDAEEIKNQFFNLKVKNSVIYINFYRCQPQSSNLLELAAKIGYAKLVDVLLTKAQEIESISPEEFYVKYNWVTSTLARNMAKIGSVALFESMQKIQAEAAFEVGLRTSKDQNSLAYIAARNGHVKLLEYFLTFFSENFLQAFEGFLSNYGDKGRNIFHEVIEKGDLETLEFLYHLVNRYQNIEGVKSFEAYLTDSIDQWNPSPFELMLQKGHIHLIKWTAEILDKESKRAKESTENKEMKENENDNEKFENLLKSYCSHEDKLFLFIPFQNADLKTIHCLEEIIGRCSFVQLCQSYVHDLLASSLLWKPTLALASYLIYLIGKKQFVEILLDLDKDPGNMPWFWLVKKRSLDKAQEKARANILSLVLSLFTSEQKLKLISLARSDGDTLLHLAAYAGYTAVFEVIAKHVDREKLIALLKLKNSKGENCLNHSVLEPFHYVSQQATFLFLKEIIGADQLLEILQETNNEGLAFIHGLAKKENNEDAVLSDLECLLKIFGSELFKKLVLQRTQKGESVFHLAAEENNVGFLKFLFKHLDENTLRELFFSQTPLGKNMLHYAARRNHNRFFDFLTQLVKPVYLKRLLLSKTKDLKTMADYLKPNSIWDRKFKILQILKQFLTAKEFNSLCRMKDGVFVVSIKGKDYPLS